MAKLDERAAVRRLLDRAGFGATADQLDSATKLGFAVTLDRLLTPSGVDPGAAATPPPRIGALPARPAAGTDRKAYSTAVREQQAELTAWWIGRMVRAEHGWLERRTLLWHGHWATSLQKVKSAAAMLAQNETMRRLGGGDFRTFARAMVRDPALMIWLDAAGNTAKAPNENLARELMELFTLGVGNYTEDDVRQAAKALTGWLIDRDAGPGYAARFAPRRHATGTQTVLGTTADFTDQSLVDLLVGRPASPRYLATRMWRWLVAPAGPTEAELTRLVTAYGPGQDLTGLFRALFTAEPFTDPASVLVRSPIEYVVGTLRALGLRPDTLSAKQRRAIAADLRGLGQVPFLPPSVGGWPAGGAWLTTAAAKTRLAFAQRVAGWADLSTVEGATAASRPELLSRLLGRPQWTDRTRSVLAAAAADPARVTALALTAPEYVVSG
jgi:uncharacterized protein (DUF1800 family)